MKVLVACECSNMVRDAFLMRGHDAYSCDLIRADHPNRNWKRHIQGDVRPLLKESWDLVIAHPPCTYLANSGVQWLDKEELRYELMLEGAIFFIDCLQANAPKVCVENPLMHIYAKEFIPWAPTQIIQPWQFGHTAQKSTCLWLKGLPQLTPTNVVDKGDFIRTKNGARIARWYAGATAKERSKTFQGVALAMAAQWG